MTLFVTVRDLHVTASLPQFQQNDFSIEKSARVSDHKVKRVEDDSCLLVERML